MAIESNLSLVRISIRSWLSVEYVVLHVVQLQPVHVALYFCDSVQGFMPQILLAWGDFFDTNHPICSFFFV